MSVSWLCNKNCSISSFWGEKAAEINSAVVWTMTKDSCCLDSAVSVSVVWTKAKMVAFL